MIRSLIVIAAACGLLLLATCELAPDDAGAACYPAAGLVRICGR
jgi:hypothetical protein